VHAIGGLRSAAGRSYRDNLGIGRGAELRREFVEVPVIDITLNLNDVALGFDRGGWRGPDRHEQNEHDEGT
jgi:hypothetical protein